MDVTTYDSGEQISNVMVMWRSPAIFIGNNDRSGNKYGKYDSALR